MIFGIALPALVGLLVEVLKKIGIVVTGDQARIANLVLSGLGSIAIGLMAEFNFVAPQFVIIVVTAVFSVVASALGYTVVERAVEK
jgi:hypothetical protein